MCILLGATGIRCVQRNLISNRGGFCKSTLAISCKYGCVGTILAGASADEASRSFFDAARNTMLVKTGVNLLPLVYRGKFVFVAEVGKPEKAMYELRDDSAPWHVSMSVMITGLWVMQNM